MCRDAIVICGRLNTVPACREMVPIEENGVQAAEQPVGDL
jgi:hypothetical protein